MGGDECSESLTNMTEEVRDKLREKYGIKPVEETGYVMGEERDYAILAKIKELEAKELSETDREMVVFIRTQLEDDWRKPILEKLNEIGGNV